MLKELALQKFQVHHVKVKSSVDGAHIRNSLVEMMSKFVTMSLNDSVYCPSWQGINQLGNLIVIISALRLFRGICPFPIGISDHAAVTDM